MIELSEYPKNKEFFMKLLEFFEEILNICNELEISPILDGSLAVFVYTQNQNTEVRDIDASIPENKFIKLIEVLKEKNIKFRLLEKQHLLQIIKDDLIIDFASQDYWLKNIPSDYQNLRINNHEVQILRSLFGLGKFPRLPDEHF